MFKIMKSDVYRILSMHRLFYGIIGVIAVLLATFFEEQLYDTDVLYTIEVIMYGMPAMLILMAGAYGYADSLCLDVENKYYRCIINRINLKRYVASKILSIFSSSVIIVTVGILSFVMILRFYIPWCDTESITYIVDVKSACFGNVLKNNLYPLYFLLFGLRYSLLAGILSVLSAYISLYIKNRMVIFILPFIGRYFCDCIVKILSSDYTLGVLFWEPYVLWESTIKTMLILLFISLSITIFLGFLILKKMKKDYLE